MKDKAMKLSIIIPVYNVEKYVEKCLRACINQDVPYEDYEIILVNDGSTDSSLSIIEKFSSDVPNCQVFSQTNMGQAVARNAGLSKAKGDYIWFIDSDDYIIDNCLGAIYRYLENGLDILQINYQNVYEDGSPNRIIERFDLDGIKNGQDVLIHRGVPIPPWASIYRRGFLLENNLTFYPHVYHEDVEFSPRTYYFAKKVTSFGPVVYNYFQRNNSTTSNRGMKHARDLITVSDSLFVFSKSIDKDSRPYFNKVIACSINWVLIIMDNVSPEDKKCLREVLRSKRYLIQAMARSDEWQYRVEARLLLLNLDLGRWLYLRLR